VIERLELNEAVCHLKRCDSTMAQLIEVVGKCRLDEKQRKVSFAALARSIVSQQLSVQAAKKTYQRLTKTLGQPEPRSILEADPKMLRGAGLSWQKVSYMIDLAKKVDSGTLLLDKLQFLPDEEVVGELTQVKGVGVWTAQMFLIFHLGRLDVLPVGDLGVRNGFRDAYGLNDLPNNETMERIAAPWKPYRSIGAWYLWRFKDTVEADV
jgi:DNA-3-methyladenine glycosylase II|tara:strand:- start:614 stop:1240 length:627 start_codon:yes stop_codon:yes gene_type:complete